jgi:hypothetical protein
VQPLSIHERQCATSAAELATIATRVREGAYSEHRLGGSLTGTRVARRAYELLDGHTSAIAAVQAQVVAALAQHVGPGPWQLTGWGNVNRHGDGNAPHHHGLHPHHWTAIYYVTVGDGARTTFFADQAAVAAAKPTYAVAPVPGLLLLFPASLWHGVETSQGLGERITLAFNAWPSVI